MNALSRSIYISVIGHLLFFFVVRLIINPLELPPAEFSPINFLGPIMGKIPLVSREERPFLIKPITRKAEFKAITNFNIAKHLYTWEDRFQHKDPLPGAAEVHGEKVFFLDKLKVKPAATIQQENFLQIEGPAGRRSVVFTPVLPALPPGYRAERAPLMVKLKFMVTPDGRTYNIEQLKTSGYADVDLLGIKFIKSLRFTPISPESRISEWGTMILNF